MTFEKMKPRIAQIGTFDVENFGDLLFPTILKFFMKKYEVDLYSPIGNMKKPFEESEYIYPISQLEENCQKYNYEAIVIGGGDLIHVKKMIAADYLVDYRAASEIWQIPIVVAKRYNIPVVLNCPGVPSEFTNAERILTKHLLKQVDYISVRDEQSKAYLEQCGIENIIVSPDTAIATPEIYNQADLQSVLCELIKTDVIPNWREYIIVQHNIINYGDSCEIKKVIEMLSLKYSYKVILLPIGYVHGDEEFLQNLANDQNSNIYLCRAKLSPKEICAVLSGCKCYIGTSLHGAVISYAYGRKVIAINTARMSKISGFFEWIDMQDSEVTDIRQLESVTLAKLNEEQKNNKYPSLRNSVIRHFNEMEKHFIQKPLSPNNQLVENILIDYHNLAEKEKGYTFQNLQTYKVYYDYGSGYAETNSCICEYEHVDEKYKAVIDIPNGVKKFRVDPIENRLIVINKLSIIGADVQYSIPFSIELNDGVLINSLDPTMEFTAPLEGKVEILFEAFFVNDLNICEIISKLNIENSNIKEKTFIMDENYKDISQKYMNLVKDYSELNAINLDINKRYSELDKKYLELKKNYNTLDEHCVILESECTSLKDELEKKVQAYDGLMHFMEHEKKKNAELKKQANIQKEMGAELVELHQQISDLDQQIKAVYNSTSWKISKPVRIVGDDLKAISRRIRPIHQMYTAMRILKNDGINALLNQIKYYEDWKKKPILESGYVEQDLEIDSEYQDNIDYTHNSTDIKALAFYLPQYHTFKENDEWWGKGFTEWTNVRSGNVRFKGHYQPRVPHVDFGYYELNNIEILKKQAKLAKQHGIYGFCFYYYWFSGKRLMEKPVDMLLEHKEVDLPFCLCWANENWTRAWDGQNKNVLIAQEYSDNDDEKFMCDLKKYVDDSRYIRIDNKPVILVYNPGQIPNCHKSFKKWREVAKEIGIGEILIWTCQTANNTAEKLKITNCIDAEVEFPPHNMWLDSAAIKNVDLNGKSAYLFDYTKLVDEIANNLESSSDTAVPVHHSCMLAWDNAARRKDAWFTYAKFSLRSLYKWVLAISDRARKDFRPEERFIFINAWNEWGEGTYLEPDERFGYANINTVSKAIFNRPFYDDLKIINDSAPEVDCTNFEKKDVEARIAVQIHMFYLETMDEIIENLNMIPFAFDCYISTDTDKKKAYIENKFRERCKSAEVYVEKFTNRGRDVAPFLLQMRKHLDKYDYICHIHSKKTKTNDHGEEWRKYIFRHLFGNQEYLRRVFYIFETNANIGIIMPETYPVLELQAVWGGNRDGVINLLEQMNIRDELPSTPIFPVGNMFWARAKAIEKLFMLDLKQDDFPEEQGQVNATLAHQIERSWVYIAKNSGYTYLKVFNNCNMDCPAMRLKKRLLIYAHYDAQNVISNNDINTLKKYHNLGMNILFSSNSKFNNEEIEKISPYVTQMLTRENKGYDFGAWRDMIRKVGKEYIKNYDEVILLNNSCLAPVFPLEEMFNLMESKRVDFWGNTIFPYSPDGSYINRECIYEHLQSYFMVFTKNVLEGETFWKFWDNVQDYDTLIDVIANCESQLTKMLSDKGYSYEPYIRETYYMSRFLNNYAIPYEKPTSLMLLKNNFTKKKCYMYMNLEEKVKLEYLLDKITDRGETQ